MINVESAFVQNQIQLLVADQAVSGLPAVESAFQLLTLFGG